MCMQMFVCIGLETSVHAIYTTRSRTGRDGPVVGDYHPVLKPGDVDDGSFDLAAPASV